MSLSCVTPPAVYVLTLADALLHCRVTEPADSPLVSSYIAAAQSALERICNRAWSEQQWKLSLPVFPSDIRNARPIVWVPPGFSSGMFPGFPHNYDPYSRRSCIELPFPPIASIDTFKYVDITGTLVDLAQTAYQVDLAAGLIAAAYDTIWPPTQPALEAVQVTFTCGKSPSAGRLLIVQQALKLTVGTWFENREAGTVPEAALALLLGAGERDLL